MRRGTYTNWIIIALVSIVLVGCDDVECDTEQTSTASTQGSQSSSVQENNTKTLNTAEAETLSTIQTFSKDTSSEIPTVEDYNALGITSVNEENLDQVNETIANLPNGNIDTIEDLKSVVDTTVESMSDEKSTSEEPATPSESLPSKESTQSEEPATPTEPLPAKDTSRSVNTENLAVAINLKVAKVESGAYTVSLETDSQHPLTTAQESIPVYGTINGGSRVILEIHNGYPDGTIFSVVVKNSNGDVVARGNPLTYTRQTSDIDFGNIEI